MKMKNKILRWLGLDTQLQALEDRLSTLERKYESVELLNRKMPEINQLLNGWDLLGKTLSMPMDIHLKSRHGQSMVIVVSKLGYQSETVRVLDVHFKDVHELRDFIKRVEHSFPEPVPYYLDAFHGRTLREYIDRD